MPYFEPYNAGAVRLNYYPPCPIPGLALGVSRHRDGGALTVLVQDETGGLQVRGKNGQWIGVKPRRDAFVINLGDLFQVSTPILRITSNSVAVFLECFTGKNVVGLNGYALLDKTLLAKIGKSSYYAL